MGMTITEKILTRGRRDADQAGRRPVVDVETSVLMDMTRQGMGDRE
jgi:hypothetical protein